MLLKTVFLLTFAGCKALALTLVPPDSGAYVGAFMDFGPTANQVSSEKITEFQALSQQQSIWAYFANDWLEGKIEFPEKEVAAISEAELIPYIRLMPWSFMADAVTEPDPIFTMDHFLEGRFDADLRRWFQQAKAFSKPLMVEFGPEVNGDWFPWNGRWNGHGKTDKYGDPKWPDGPEKFRDTYRRIIHLAREEGALNITWVFHVDTARSPETEWNEIRYYYPGNEWIDWIGLSVFGSQLPTHSWVSFHSKLKAFLPELKSLNSDKPWLISEAAVIEDGKNPKRKAEWIRQAFQSVELGIFKQVKGFSYWHSPGWLANGKANFKIDSSAQSLQAYRTEVLKPFWRQDPVFKPSQKPRKPRPQFPRPTSIHKTIGGLEDCPGQG